jgi:hypothetical protein
MRKLVSVQKTRVISNVKKLHVSRNYDVEDKKITHFLSLILNLCFFTQN